MKEELLLLRDEAIRHDLESFVVKCFSTVNPGDPFINNWHIKLICEYLSACQDGQIKRLIINIPPRYLKSLCVSVAWPAWLLGRQPTSRIIVSSYSERLSIKHSVDCRNITTSSWYKKIFPQVKLLDCQNRKEKFMTSSMGFRLATSTGGSITGEGGNFLIVDDPHNPTTINSSKIRHHTLEWFDKTFSTRLNDKKNGVFVIVMQRLHYNDLTAHLLERGGWEHLCLPAFSEQANLISFNNFNYHRKSGEALHAEREDVAEFETIKKDLGSRGFLAQYQQNPSPEESGVVRMEWFKRYKIPPDLYLNLVQSWDTATKTGQGNDYSVCTTWLQTDNAYYLIDVLRHKLEYPDLENSIKNMAEKYNPNAVLIEDKSSGQGLIQAIRRSSSFPIIAISPSHDKTSRFIAISPIIEAGKVYLPERAPWLLDYEMELLRFPNIPHDDQVDSTSQFFNWITPGKAGNFRIRRL